MQEIKYAASYKQMSVVIVFIGTLAFLLFALSEFMDYDGLSPNVQMIATMPWPSLLASKPKWPVTLSFTQTANWSTPTFFLSAYADCALLSDAKECRVVIIGIAQANADAKSLGLEQCVFRSRYRNNKIYSREVSGGFAFLREYRGHGQLGYRDCIFECQIAFHWEQVMSLEVAVTAAGGVQSILEYINVTLPPMRFALSPSMAICVSCALYGNRSALLVEWLEYHLSIGAGRIHLYDNASTQKTKAVLSYYYSLYPDRISVYNYTLPGNNVSVSMYSTIAMIQDCVHRAMYENSLVLVYDLDEFLVPRLHSSWPEMLATLPQATGIRFYRRTFVSACTSIMPNDVVTMKSTRFFDPVTHFQGRRLKKPVSSFEQLSDMEKSAVVPLAYKLTGIHRQYGFNAPRHVTHDVSSSIAIINHYHSKCERAEPRGICLNCNETSMDDRILHFMEPLLPRIQRVRELLGIDQWSIVV
mmetsp:Transcript_8990/g.14720  ORF Transcript_8990/g.14720 Transcript_8990/m.14720 type:complete len:472 (+) Transcript_8990:126-1541(+)|eukprot:CAMPEP_0184659084 /NCGR_PEP_ID=MMETSP0308-20130426/28133_1 /TAXON_ID=38269 /ORGANISM="Gloeochaete witrockiana, Strain SAG 46.84" /LENGTH=471 /DNA_ID=CAMNT_0027098599 /DNA_START=125 /DNA_END=1540 /DNA_ORIENTATION=-